MSRVAAYTPLRADRQDVERGEELFLAGTHGSGSRPRPQHQHHRRSPKPLESTGRLLRPDTDRRVPRDVRACVRLLSAPGQTPRSRLCLVSSAAASSFFYSSSLRSSSAPLSCMYPLRCRAASTFRSCSLRTRLVSFSCSWSEFRCSPENDPRGRRSATFGTLGSLERPAARRGAGRELIRFDRSCPSHQTVSTRSITSQLTG